MEWIAVSEELPKADELVLVYDDVEGIYVGSRIDAGKWKIYATDNVTEKVTHWMPLPEKPQDPVLKKITDEISKAVAGSEITLPGTSIIDTSTVDKIAAEHAKDKGINYILSPGVQTTTINFTE